MSAVTAKPPPGLGPALNSPPPVTTRSIMPVTPWPIRSGSIGPPRPSSSTRMPIRLGPQSIRTLARVASAWRMTFVSDSWTTR
jgi:hypothetical protein